MTRDEIIKLAREADMDVDHAESNAWGAIITAEPADLERFAYLVAAKEREECAKVASERQHWPMPRFTHAPSERTMGRIDGEKEMSRQIAAAIRARGE